VRFEYDSKIHSLVWENAAELVHNYEIPVAFEPNNNFPLGYLSRRLISHKRCEQLRPLKRDTFELQVFGVHVANSKRPNVGIFLSQCQLSNHEAPNKKLAVVTTSKANRRFHGILFETAHHELGFEDEHIGNLTTAKINQLPWFPFFMIGCFLNSGQASWDCFAQFHGEVRMLPNALNNKNVVDVETAEVASALGLRHYTTADYDNWRDDLENASFVDEWLLGRTTATPQDFNEWGVKKNSPYMPNISFKNGYESFEGGIYPRKEGGEFLAFMRRNVGKTVEVNASIGSGVNVSPTQQLIQIWGVCKNSDECSRTDYTFKFLGAKIDMFDKRRITGRWKVGMFRVNPNSGNDSDTEIILESVVP
jgi:hypothetical protein